MRRKKFAATFPILFISMTYFVQAQSFDVEKSSKMIERSISDIKKSKSDKIKAEIELAKRTGELSNACTKVSEEIKNHNLKVGPIGGNCSRADAELKSAQSRLEKALEATSDIEVMLEGLKDSKKELAKMKLLDDSSLNVKLLEIQRDKNKAQEKLKTDALYDSDRKLIGGELKKMKEELKKDFDRCFEANDFSQNAYGLCMTSTKQRDLLFRIESIEKDVFKSKKIILTSNENESALIALKSKLPRDRSVSLNSQITELDKRIKQAEAIKILQSTNVVVQKLGVTKAFENFSKANHPKGACKLLGVISIPPECSL